MAAYGARYTCKYTCSGRRASSSSWCDHHGNVPIMARHAHEHTQPREVAHVHHQSVCGSGLFVRDLLDNDHLCSVAHVAHVQRDRNECRNVGMPVLAPSHGTRCGGRWYPGLSGTSPFARPPSGPPPAGRRKTRTYVANDPRRCYVPLLAPPTIASCTP